VLAFFYLLMHINFCVGVSPMKLHPHITMRRSPEEVILCGDRRTAVTFWS
jgi:hypothetical protein